jgi:DNA invertase Pin-like site-specific DNA recombinase/Arc/MetJ family transcription regulator
MRSTTTAAPAATLRAALYLRISEDKTGEEAAVTRQREDGAALIGRRGWWLAREFADNSVSAAGKVQRPQFAALLDAVRAGLVDVIVAWALDRLCRTARDRLALVEACRDAGVMIALVRGSDMDPTTPAGRLALGILGEVAQHEIDQKSDRQRRAWQQRVTDGKPTHFTQSPFGWLADRVTEHPTEGPAIRAAAEHVLSGGSLRSVARQWEALGLATPQSGDARWNPVVIRSMLLNPRLAGLSVYKGEVVGQGQWAAIITEETHRALVAHLTDPGRSRQRPGGSHRTLLGGLALCPCGQPVYGGRANGGQAVLRCIALHRGEGAAGGHVTRKREPVEDYVSALVVARLSRPDAADLLAADQDGPDVEALRSTARSVRVQLDEVAGDLDLPLSVVRTRSAALAARLADVESALADAGRVSALAPLVVADDVQTAWDALDLDVKREVVDTLMTVTVHSPGRGAHARTFRPETVTINWRVSLSE